MPDLQFCAINRFPQLQIWARATSSSRFRPESRAGFEAQRLLYYRHPVLGLIARYPRLKGVLALSEEPVCGTAL
jgi:hypothetical protein